MKIGTLCFFAIALLFSGVGELIAGLNLQIINNVADPTAGKITVKINGQTIASPFEFRHATPMQEMPLPIQLNITSSNTFFAPIERTFTADLYEGGTIILTLHGVGKPEDFSNDIAGRDISYTLHEHAVLTGNINPSKVNLTALHAVTDLPIMELGVGGNQFIATDLDYATTPDFPLPLVPRKYTLSLAPNGKPTEPWKVGEADFSKDIGKFIYIVPSGFLNPAANQNGPELKLIAVYPDGKVVVLDEPKEKTYARMSLIYAGSDPNASTVDMYANATKIADNIPFIGATPFFDVAADDPIVLTVAGPNSNAADDKVLATLPSFRLTTNANHIVIIHGVVAASGFAPNPDGSPITLSYSVIENAPVVSSGGPTSVDVAVCNAITDAGALSVRAGDISVVASSLAYRGVTPYQAVESSTDAVSATQKIGNETSIVGVYDADFAAFGGKPVVLLAAGFLKPSENNNGAERGLYVITTTGTITKLIPPAVSVGEEQPQNVLSLANYPNPADAFTTVTYELRSPVAVTLSLYDATGRVVYRTERGVEHAGAHTVQLPTSELAQGVYRCALQAGAHVVTHSVHVVR